MFWRCDTTGETTPCLCVHNLSAEPREVRLKLAADDEAGVCARESACPMSTASPKKVAHHRVLLEAYGYRWYRVCGLDYLLKRSAI